MKKTLEALIKLQEIDCQLRTLEQSKGDLPQRVAELMQDIERLQVQLEQKVDGIEQQKTAKRDAELEITSLKEKLKKYQSQQYLVKTNKEYDAITVEMENTQATIEKTEFKILETDESVQKLDVQVTELRPQLEQLQQTLQENQVKLQEMLGQTADREAVLQGKRQEILVTLPKPIINTYERIRLGRGGMALAFLKDGACSQCSSRIPPQRGLEIRTMTNMYVCEVCGRILVWQEGRTKPCAEDKAV